MFEYKADPIEVLGKISEKQYELAKLPCHCGRCGGIAGSRVYREWLIPIEAGNWMRINSRSSRLCGKCLPVVVAEKFKENARVHHDLSKDRLLYTEIIKRESGGNDYREHWQMV